MKKSIIRSSICSSLILGSMSACMIPSSSVQGPTNDLSEKQFFQESILLEKPSANKHNRRLLRPSKKVESSIHILKNDFSIQGEDTVNIKTVAPFPYSTSSATVSGSILFDEGGTKRVESWNTSNGNLILKNFSITPDAGGAKISATVSTTAGPSSYFITAIAPVSAPAPDATEYAMSAPLDSSTSAYVLSHDPTGTTRRYKFTQGNVSAVANNGQIEVKMSGLYSPALTRRQCFVIGTRIECADITEGNNQILSGNVTLNSSFTQNEYALKIESDHDVIGEGQDSQESNISLQTFGTEKDWTVKIDDGEELRILRGTGDLPLLTTLKAEDLEEGIYEISANYDEFPDDIASILVEVIKEPLLCGGDAPILPQDLDDLLSQLSGGIDPFGGSFAIQSENNDSLIRFTKAQKSMDKIKQKLSSLDYQSADLEDLTRETVPIIDSNTPQNKINKINGFLDTFFEQKMFREEARLIEITKGRKLFDALEKFKSYTTTNTGLEFFDEDFQRDSDFLQFKTLSDQVITSFKESISTNTTYGLFEAAQDYFTLLHVYMEVSAGYLKNYYPIDENIDDYPYENITSEKINSPLKLLKHLERKLTSFNNQINSKRSKLVQKFSETDNFFSSLENDLDTTDTELNSFDNELLLLEQEEQNLLNDLNISIPDAFTTSSYDGIGGGYKQIGVGSFQGRSALGRPAQIRRSKTSSGSKSLKGNSKTGTATNLYNTIARSTGKISNIGKRLQANQAKIDTALRRNADALKQNISPQAKQRLRNFRKKLKAASKTNQKNIRSNNKREADARAKKAEADAIARQCVPQEFFNGLSSWPGVPNGWTAIDSGRPYTVKNKALLASLRKIIPGQWRKVFQNGRLPNGEYQRIHFHRHSSGQIFGAKTKGRPVRTPTPYED